MPFFGPSRQYRPAGPSQALAEALQAALESRNRQPSGGGISSSYQDEQDHERDYNEQGRAQYAMTPGITEGTQGASDVGVAYSPYLSPRSFERFGKRYSFDPAAAAASEGAASGIRTNVDNKSRYDALTQIPGVLPGNAARQIYGHGVIDETQPMHEALSAVVGSDPSDVVGRRKLAAKAVALGADANQFRYLDEPEAKGDRFSKVTGPGGQIGVLDMTTGEVKWTGEQQEEKGKNAADVAAANADRERGIQYRSATAKAEQTQRDFLGVMGKRDKAYTPVVDPTTFKVDSAATSARLRAFLADSTDVDQRRQRARANADALTPPPPGTLTGDSRTPSAPVTADDLRRSGLFAGPSAAPSAAPVPAKPAAPKKVPSAQQRADAAKDAGYKQSLIAKGYDFGTGGDEEDPSTDLPEDDTDDVG